MSPTRRELVRATRTRIVDAAGRLTRERGASGFSMDVLAKEAGVARATVYEHFRSKRAVLDELASSIARTRDDGREPAPSTSDPLVALRDMLGAVCRHWAEHEERMNGLRTLTALTGGDQAGEGIDEKQLRRLVEALAAAGPDARALDRRRGHRRARRAHVVRDLRAAPARAAHARTGRGRARQARGVDRQPGRRRSHSHVATTRPTYVTRRYAAAAKSTKPNSSPAGRNAARTRMPTRASAGIEVGHRRDQPGAVLVEVDRRDHEREPLVERRHTVLADHRERVDRAVAARGHPFERLLAAVAAQHARVVLVPPAGRAVLDAQLAAARAFPELAVLVRRPRHQPLRDVGPVLRAPVGHQFASVPSTTVPWVDSQPPLPCATAISAPGDLTVARLAAQLARRLAQQEQAAHARDACTRARRRRCSSAARRRGAGCRRCR